MKFKKRKGFASLLNAILASIIGALIASGMATSTSSQFATLGASRIGMNTQALASAKAKEISLVNYTLADTLIESRTPITSEYDREILVGPEVDLGDHNKKKDITVNIYKHGESQPRESVIVPLTAQGSGAVPIGSIIAWSSDTLPEYPGIWLECNGQAVDAAQYPALYALMHNVPDYQGVFLRGYGSQNSADAYGNVTHSSGALNTTQGDAVRNIIGDLGSQQFGSNNGGVNGNYGGSSNVFYYETSRFPGCDGLFPDGLSSFPSNNSGSNYPFWSSDFGFGWDEALTKYKYTLTGDPLSGYTLQESTVKPSLYFFSQHRYIQMDLSLQVPTANENRPVNKAVKWLIKAR